MSEQAIWKFQLPAIVAPTIIPMPGGAQILHVKWQHHHACMWALVNTPPADITMRKFKIVATGETMPPEFKYIGTVHDNCGLVWHILEVPE